MKSLIILALCLSACSDEYESANVELVCDDGSCSELAGKVCQGSWRIAPESRARVETQRVGLEQVVKWTTLTIQCKRK